MQKSSYKTYQTFLYVRQTNTGRYNRPGAKVVKLFSCSTQLSMKFILLINFKIAKIDGIFRFNSVSQPFIQLINVKMPTINC